jgi:hypothetical protein
MPQKTLNAVGATSGDVSQLLPDKGRGVKRTVLIHVYNSANVTAFIAHRPEELKEPLTVPDAALGSQGGIPIGKNGVPTPFLVDNWEGEMWGVGSVAGVICWVEDAFS